MKVAILTMVWKRHKLFDLWAYCIKELIKQHSDVDFEVICTGSEGKISRETVEKHGFTYHEYSNTPLGLKAQYHVEAARRSNADYYFFLGSDDLVSPQTFNYYKKKIKSGHDHIAPMDLYFMGSVGGVLDLHYSKGYKKDHKRHKEPMAVGRCISRDVLNRCGWKMYDTTRKAGIDSGSWKTIRENSKNPHYFYLKDTGGFIVDYKTDVNMGGLRPYLYDGIAEKDLKEYVPQSILNKIKHFHTNKNASIYDLEESGFVNLIGNWIHHTAIVYPNVNMGIGNIIGAYSVIGSNGEIRNTKPHEFKGEVVIGDNNVISEHVTIQRPLEEGRVTAVGDGNIIMAHSHLGHDCSIGSDCEICTTVVIGGYTTIQDDVKVKLHSVIRNRITICEGTIIGMGAVVTKDIAEKGVYVGNPARKIEKK